MTDALAKPSAIERWRPEFGPLPDGWIVMRIDMELSDYGPPEASVEFAHGPARRPRFLRLRVNPGTTDVREWLYPLMEQIARLPHETTVDVDARIPMYGA